MKYHDYLTRRYLKKRWAPWAATVAVTLGVFSLLTVLAVMEGFKIEMRERIRGTLSHLVVEADPFRGLVGEDQLLEAIESVPGVKAAAPTIPKPINRLRALRSKPDLTTSSYARPAFLPCNAAILVASALDWVVQFSSRSQR